MRRINYPNAYIMDSLMKEYKDIFHENLQIMQDRWDILKRQLWQYSRNEFPQQLYPDNIIDIFLKTYSQLVDMYIDYIDIQGSKKTRNHEELHTELKKLFHYSGVDTPIVDAYQPKIADFFMKYSKELDLSVCFYCETSFINTYGFSNVYKDFATFLTSADKYLLKRYIRSEEDEEYTDSVINAIFNLCHGTDVSNVVDIFNNYRYFRNMNPSKSERLEKKFRNHFDLDHFLPKSVCPLVGLSFYNFVPSCSVCNEKLKGADKIGGTDKTKLLMLSPTSENYQFDQEITIKIAYDTNVSMLRMQEHPNDFRLEFTPRESIYQEIINEVRLDERYNYHKQLALKQYDLYQDFAPGHISQLEVLFNGTKTREEIENQIFRGEYTEDKARCFDKLKNDIKKQCGK